MAKIAATAMFAVVALIAIIAAAVSGVVAAIFGGGNSTASSQPSPAALADIPGNYLALYQQAATTCSGLDWTILAAVGKIETNHGRLNADGVHSGENFAHAGGPMQFLQPTFRWVLDQSAKQGKHIPPGGSTPPSRYNVHDAIYAASFYLCMSGADRGDLYGAIFTYNHADWYVRKVLDQANAYKAAQQSAPQQGGWTVPARGTCTSGFGSRGGEFHRGQDIAAPIGTPIVAASSGTVIDSGPATGYGLWVRIEHANGVITTYGHNEHNQVHVGQKVQVGQLIAEVGNRGESTGSHLHFQIDVGNQSVDPVAFYHDQSAPRLCGQSQLGP
ncbi:peptidoglycan DD-metalloendopeptidase family protein [Sciscionella marina]|uniref:peptidoglycan DD-metalloendopeptidase family protein n=1 Tax=Sciscionella marina TaxID=508770 RepID=UPI00035EB4C3|nr:peptidoglycan DD-metalloendopeptidase family protein [Sciscionella marina]